MKRLLILMLCSLWSLAAVAVPPIETWETENGAKVLFMAARDLPMVDARVTFRAGSARDGDLPGLARLTNAVLVEGAAGIPGQALFQRLEDVGAEFSNGSYRDMALLSLRVLSDPQPLQAASEVIAAMLTQPDFPAAAVARDRAALLAAVQARAESARALADVKVFETLYAGHPYAHPPGGTEASLRAMTRTDLIAFHRRYYVARNAVVALVGDLDRRQAEALAEKLVGGLSAGDRAPSLPPPRSLERRAPIHISYSGTQSHVSLTGVGVGHGDPDRQALTVGNHLLGGNGLVSLLSEKLRGELGLTYSVSSRFMAMSAPGPFRMSLQTRADQADAALAAMREVLDAFMDTPPDPEQVAQTKQNLTGGFALEIAGNAALLGQLSYIGFYDYPLDWLDTYIDRVNAVTPTQIQDAFRRRVDRGALLTIVVGPEPTGDKAEE